MATPSILGIGTAVPPYSYDQAEIMPIVRGLFKERVENLDRLLKVFEHSHIRRRHFVREPEWYISDHGFGEANRVFAQSSTELCLSAAGKALAKSGIDPREVGAVVAVSSTGVMTPSLDAVLIQELGLSLNARRIPIFGLGCAGGVTGLARAAEQSTALAGAPVLFVAVEICSITFQKNDISKANLIGTSIFADGAAALVVGAGPGGPQVVSSYHQLFADTYDIMGWEVADSGLKVLFSRDIPTFVRTHIPRVVDEACKNWKIDRKAISSYITHPGGAKVLDAFADALGIDQNMLLPAYEVLREYGNMSSASVLFVLDNMLANNRLKPGYGLMSALGPGFSSDQLLLKMA